MTKEQFENNKQLYLGANVNTAIRMMKLNGQEYVNELASFLKPLPNLPNTVENVATRMCTGVY